MKFSEKMQMKQPSRQPIRRIDKADTISPKELKRQKDEQMYQVAIRKKNSFFRIVFEWAFQIILVIMFAYVLVYFFGQTRTNVGQSMDNTLAGGDVVLINALAYQMGGPERGDIISFKPNGNESSRSSIKRVIGLPGETIQIINGMIYINGNVYLENMGFPKIINAGMAAEAITLDDTEYFVLGDNRNNSEDSRFADIGLVSSDTIEGKVWCILRPSSHRRLL